MTSVKGQRRRGRPARTTRAEVVAAATRIVDAEGVEALTIRRLASDCGLSPMGVYRYVRDRDELLDLVVQHILEELPADAGGGTWRQRATGLFGGFRRMALAHPGVTALGVGRVSPVPAMARFTDRALQIMDEAGLRGREAVMAYDALLMFTVGSVLWQFPRRGDERLRLLDALTPEGEAATHLVRYAEDLGKRDADRYFSYGLAVLLAGLEGSVRRSRGTPGSSRAR